MNRSYKGGIAALYLIVLSAVTLMTSGCGPGKGSLVISSDPIGAEVYVNGSPKGTAPLELSGLKPGQYVVELRKEGRDRTFKSVALLEKQNLAVDLKLKQTTGLMLVESAPQGVDVVVDGVSKGNTPLLLTDLSLAKRGIVLFVGATGTGKSTSLAAMLGYRNKRMSGHIISVEDPIEYVHFHGKSLVTQREVGIDTDSFEVALRNTLRQAPDVIMIGEVRTRETMEHAITFAETGHLVLCTLHANNANQALDRILHFFPDEAKEQVLLDLSFNMRAIVAQQLVPSADQTRRWAAVEVLLATPLVQERIRNGEITELKKIMKESTHHGMITFDQCLFGMYKEGKITYDEAIRHADSANEVRLAVKMSEGGDAESLSEGLKDVEVLDY